MMPRRFAELSGLLHRLKLFDEARWYQRQAHRLVTHHSRGPGLATGATDAGI